MNNVDLFLLFFKKKGGQGTINHQQENNSATYWLGNEGPDCHSNYIAYLDL